MEVLSLTACGLPYLMVAQPIASGPPAIAVVLHRQPGLPARQPREFYFGPESGSMTLAEISGLRKGD